FAFGVLLLRDLQVIELVVTLDKSLVSVERLAVGLFGGGVIAAPGESAGHLDGDALVAGCDRVGFAVLFERTGEQLAAILAARRAVRLRRAREIQVAGEAVSIEGVGIA